MKKLKPIHPGRILREEFAERGYSNFLADMQEIMSEKKDIDVEIATILSKILGTTIGFWINLQNLYNRQIEEDKND